MKLATEPFENVIVRSISTDSTIATVSGALIFAPTNWSVARSVTVRGEQDDDAQDELTSISHTVTGYGGITTASTVEVVVIDDDEVTDDDTAPTVSLALSKTSISENGGVSTVTAELSGASSAAVTVDVAATTASGTGTYTLSTNKRLTIAAGSTSSTGTVTITATNNDVDAPNTSVTVAGTSNGGGVANPTSKTLTITDDDDRGLVLSPNSVSVTEAPGAGRTSIYTVALATQPTNSVRVTFASRDPTVATATPDSLTFTASNWNDERTVTVQAIDDDILNNPNRTTTIPHFAHGGDYDQLTDKVTVTVVDDEEQPNELTLLTTKLAVPEDAGTVEVTISLDREALVTTDVILDVGEASTATGEGVDYTLTKRTLTIAKGERTSKSSLTVIDDNLDEVNETILLTARSPALISNQLEITIVDNDTARVLVSPLTLSVDEGSSATYSVKLATEPFEDVVVRPKSADSTIATVSELLTFSPTNWMNTQLITVRGEQDDDAQDELTSISHTVTGYGGITDASTVEVSVIDDEAPGVVITPQTLTITEGGGAKYGVYLSAKPSDTVTVTPTSDQPSVVSTNRNLTFDRSNWSTVQYVTIHTSHDDDDEDNMVSIRHVVSGFGSVTTAPSVLVVITDDDSAGVIISPLFVSMMEGDQTQYSMRLGTRPSTEVKVLCEVEDESVAHVGTIGFVIFTPENWHVEQDVTVFSVIDGDAVPEETRISHPVVGYNGVEYGETVAVSVNEVGPTPMDPPSELRVIVEPTTLSVREGSDASYSIRVSEAPSESLAITSLVDDISIATVREAIVFDNQNWREPQKIVVYGQHDDDHSNEGTTIRHRAVPKRCRTPH